MAEHKILGKYPNINAIRPKWRLGQLLNSAKVRFIKSYLLNY